MDIQLSVAQYGTNSGTLTYNLYDPSAPSVVVATQSLTLPIVNTVVTVFPNLEDKTYIARAFRNQTQIGSDFYAYPGIVNSATVRDDLWMVKGQDGGFDNDLVTVNNTSLIGWKYSLEQKGVGTLRPDVDYLVLSSGGIQLINGYQLQDGEALIFHFQPQVKAASSTTSTSALIKFKDFRIITDDDTVLSSDDIGKTIMIAGASGNTPKITLPDPTTVVDNIITCIQSNGGSHKMCSIIATTQFSWLGGNRTTIHMGQSEELWIYKNGSTWYVANSDGNFKTVGRIDSSFLGSDFNTLLLNGNVYSKALYPRIYEWITTELDPNMIVSEANWGVKNSSTGAYDNVGKFTIDAANNSFRVPLVMEAYDSANNQVTGGFLRGCGQPFGNISGGLTGNTTPGRNQLSAVGKFFSDIAGALIYKSGASNAIIALGLPMQGGGTAPSDIDHSDGVNNIKLNTPIAGKSISGINTYTLNKETRPSGIACYKLIRY